MDHLHHHQDQSGIHNYSGNEALPEMAFTLPSINISNVTRSRIWTNGEAHSVYDPFILGLTTIVSPALCVFGFTGNILNILVLTRRRMQASIDNKMERTACMGLIALAISDMLYCVIAFPEAFNTETSLIYDDIFWIYYTAYNTYLRNVFSYWSTWLTVILAVGRYVAICHPLHARMFVNPGATKFGIVIALIVWAGLVLPEAFMYEIFPPEEGEVGYFLDLGVYNKNATLRRTFSYICCILGFLIPVSMLAFCNINLIRALRESYQMRKEYRVHGKNPQTKSRITPTLITIIVMFIILVTPSELLNLITLISGGDQHHTSFAIQVTNILHTINFSVNFVLYCVVNVHFRDTLRDLFCCCRKKKGRFERGYTASYSNVTTKSFVVGPTSNETAL